MKKTKNLINPGYYIYIRISVNGQREEWSTQSQCQREEWDGQKSRLKGNAPDARYINSWLDTLQGRALLSRQELYSTGKSYNPLDKVVELYERLLASEREKTELRGNK